MTNHEKTLKHRNTNFSQGLSYFSVPQIFSVILFDVQRERAELLEIRSCKILLVFRCFCVFSRGTSPI